MVDEDLLLMSNAIKELISDFSDSRVLERAWSFPESVESVERLGLSNKLKSVISEPGGLSSEENTEAFWRYMSDSDSLKIVGARNIFYSYAVETERGRFFPDKKLKQGSDEDLVLFLLREALSDEGRHRQIRKASHPSPSKRALSRQLH